MVNNRDGSGITKGKIHKIVIGNNLSTYYTVGAPNKIINAAVSEIIEDINYLTEHDESRFLVIAKDDETGHEWVWVEIVNMPHTLQYDKPNGDPQNII